ncbi:CatB-related O-acetyltransferase [Amylibacter sp.]|nr:CatB-related O-acetyltransferase [Amylibacter sp.]
MYRLVSLLRLIKLIIESKFNNANLHWFCRYSGTNSFGKHSRVFRNVSFHDVTLGRHSYVNTHSRISRCDIGHFTSIGRRVTIGGLGSHKLTLSSHPSFYDVNPPGFSFYCDESFDPYKKVKIGNDVWIGDQAIIHDGVEIGDGAIIGTGAIVHKDVPPYAIVVGNPMSILRFRFDDTKISELLNMKWWDKSDEDIQENVERIILEDSTPW